jgi:hypothetical protein
MFTKLLKAGCFVLLVSFMTGCASVPMPKGSSKGYSTVRYIAPNAPLGEDASPRFVEANRMIKDAVASEMEKNGLQVVEGNADLIAAHLIILQDNASTSYCNQYYGVQDFFKIVSLAHKEGMKKDYPEHVQKRALVIDLIDANTYKLVYRDYVVSGSLANLSEQDRKTFIDSMVAQTLQQFFR